jgi:AcrR family transcriptional regulator
VIDGLREYKKRQTRQRISDVATGMFMSRGFESVTIAEIAAAADVSEKTVYNYFPTKESLVYDQADEQLERLITAVRERPRGSTPTSAFVVALKEDSVRFSEMLGDERVSRIGEFGAMVRSTPALRAAWGEYRHRIVAALTAVLADDLGVDPSDPEPVIAARALVSLLELYYDARLRHSQSGVGTRGLQTLIEADIDRGARLLDTGMWSLHLLVEGRRTKDQIRDAAVVAEQARQQVLAAVREAKRTWRDIRAEAKAAGREARFDVNAQVRAAAREAHEQARAAAREKHRQARAAAVAAAREKQSEKARQRARQTAGEQVGEKASEKAGENAHEKHARANQRQPPV